MNRFFYRFFRKYRYLLLILFLVGMIAGSIDIIVNGSALYVTFIISYVFGALNVILFEKSSDLFFKKNNILYFLFIILRIVILILCFVSVAFYLKTYNYSLTYMIGSIITLVVYYLFCAFKR